MPCDPGDRVGGDEVQAHTKTHLDLVVDPGCLLPVALPDAEIEAFQRRAPLDRRSASTGCGSGEAEWHLLRDPAQLQLTRRRIATVRTPRECRGLLPW